MPDIAAVVAAVRGGYPGCFACGDDNPIGLHLGGFTVDEAGDLVAHFHPRPDYRGTGDTLHGGVAATALDEICVWAGIVGEGVVTVTATLDLKYRRPLTIHDDITARARVVERRGRRLRISGELIAADAVAVQGRGLFLAVDEP